MRFVMFLTTYKKLLLPGKNFIWMKTTLIKNEISNASNKIFIFAA